jgi:micrococcal nuclease
VTGATVPGGSETTVTPEPTIDSSDAATTTTGATIHAPSTSVASTTTSSSVEPPPDDDGDLLAPPTAGASGDPAAEPPSGSVPVTVVSITDGDTLEVRFDDGLDDTVRLIGINSPESGECFSDEATRVLNALTPAGARIWMTSDVSDLDRFDRFLRYVWVGAMSVNEEMVRRGVAIARRYPPDTAMADRFDSAQTAAKEAGVGVWASEACGPRSESDLVIADLVFDAPGDDSQNLNEEWIRIRNDGDAPADLTGWGIKDESASNRYRFPDGFTLAPGESVTVHSGCGTDFDSDLFWCSVGSAVWNNDGDTVFLLDPNGSTHVSRTYDEADTTAAPVTTVQRFVGGGDDCDSSYPDVCIPSGPPDLDCGDISFRRFRVVSPDPHGFDGNADGVGCES